MAGEGGAPMAEDVAEPVPPEEYNYAHFHPTILAKDAWLTMKSKGPEPGEWAPDFELTDTEDRRWRLSDLRGQPVALIFGSGT